jgi:hypothetical protein
VTGHIVPWNYPSQIFGRSVGAALAAGNACVLKPPEDACLALLEIAHLASRRAFRRRAERGHRPRQRGGSRALGASRHRPHLVHRLAAPARRWPRPPRRTTAR